MTIDINDLNGEIIELEDIVFNDMIADDVHYTFNVEITDPQALLSDLDIDKDDYTDIDDLLTDVVNRVQEWDTTRELSGLTQEF